MSIYTDKLYIHSRAWCIKQIY